MSKKKKGKRNSWITVDSFFFKKSFYFWTVRFALRFMPVSMRKKKLASATAEIRLHALEFTICFFYKFYFLLHTTYNIITYELQCKL